jgi:DNA mismatch repair protein MutH
MQELDIKKYFNYDHTDEESIMARARLLKGKTLGFISENSPYEKDLLKKTNKGKVGNFIEKHWFGIPNNSRPEPDFAEAGIELKVCSINKNKGRTVKWNQKICSINYFTLHDEEWISSHTKLKINKVLFVYYLSDDVENPWSSQIVLDVDLWELKPNEEVIVPEWESAKNKVRKGLAHKLTIAGCKYLGANTSGTSRLVPQPVTKYQKLAKERSFYFQRSFVDINWQKVRKSESIIESLNLSSMSYFESSIKDAINLYQGKTLGEIAHLHGIKVPSGKAAVPTILKLAIGFKSVKSKIKEFDKLGILVKTIPIKKTDNYPYEAVSFPKFVIKELIQEEWNSSSLSTYFKKILFIPVSREKRKGISIENRILEKAFFWSPTFEELRIIQDEWLNYKKQASSKLLIKKVPINSKKGKGYKEVITNLSNESDTKIIHVRPHGQNSDDRDEDSFGTSVIKQSFWLNKDFLHKLVNNALNE